MLKLESVQNAGYHQNMIRGGGILRDHGSVENLQRLHVDAIAD